MRAPGTPGPGSPGSGTGQPRGLLLLALFPWQRLTMALGGGGVLHPLGHPAWAEVGEPCGSWLWGRGGHKNEVPPTCCWLVSLPRLTSHVFRVTEVT